MKEVYEKPLIEIEEFEVEEFEVEDILTLSSNSVGTGDELGVDIS